MLSHHGANLPTLPSPGAPGILLARPRFHSSSITIWRPLAAVMNVPSKTRTTYGLEGSTNDQREGSTKLHKVAISWRSLVVIRVRGGPFMIFGDEVSRCENTLGSTVTIASAKNSAAGFTLKIESPGLCSWFRSSVGLNERPRVHHEASISIALDLCVTQPHVLSVFRSVCRWTTNFNGVTSFKDYNIYT